MSIPDVCHLCGTWRPANEIHGYRVDPEAGSIQQAEICADKDHCVYVCYRCEESIVEAHFNRTGQTVMTALPVPQSEEAQAGT